MKRMLMTLPIVTSIVLLMIGADFRSQEPAAIVEVRKHCAGYTIIEAGLGVDCNGDTVKLVKKYGYYEIAGRYQKDDLAIQVN